MMRNLLMMIKERGFNPKVEPLSALTIQPQPGKRQPRLPQEETRPSYRVGSHHLKDLQKVIDLSG